MTAPYWLLIASIAGNAILALAVYSLRQTIKVESLSLFREIAELFATKTELREVETRFEKQIALRDEVRQGFSRLGIELDERRQT